MCQRIIAARQSGWGGPCLGCNASQIEGIWYYGQHIASAAASLEVLTVHTFLLSITRCAVSYLSVYMYAGLDVDSLLLNFGRVLEYSNCKQAQLTGRNPPTREYAPADELAIAATARRLLSFACQVGWAAVSEMLLPAVLVDGQSIDELVSELDKISDQGLTLLHHAVRSRSASLVSHTEFAAGHDFIT